MEELNELEKDITAEVGNISMGAAATALSALLGRRVKITTPRLEILAPDEIKSRYPIPCIAIEVHYLSGLRGNNLLLLKEEDAALIAGVMLALPEGESAAILDEMSLSAVEEAMNQMMGLMATSMSEMFRQKVEISPPLVRRLNLSDDSASLASLAGSDRVVHLSFFIEVEKLLESHLIQMVPLNFAREMASYLLAEDPLTGFPGEDDLRGDPAGLEAKAANQTGQQAASSAGAATREAVAPGNDFAVDQHPGREAAGDLKALAAADTLQKLEMLKDIPVKLAVVLGTARLPLESLFAMPMGGIIELDRLEGEPLNITVNDKLFARGEIVSFNGQLGVKIIGRPGRAAFEDKGG